MAKTQPARRVRKNQGAPLKVRSDRRERGKCKTLSSTGVYGVPVPERLHEAIENERENLSKAESILACMVVAMDHADDPLTGPDFSTVAQTAREMVERSINGLDSVILKQRLLNRIEDGFTTSFIAHLPAPLLKCAEARLAYG